jgi:hypothetical protein
MLSILAFVVVTFLSYMSHIERMPSIFGRSRYKQTCL